MPMIRVLITRRFPEVAAAVLRDAGFQVDVHDSDTPFAPGEFAARARGVGGILCAFRDRVEEGVLAGVGDGLRVVANCAVGYENVDLAACHRRGVVVTNTPGVLTDTTADLTWALLLATARRIAEGDRLVRAGRWTGWAPTQMLGLELRGATLGIVGAGRIGTAVALRAAAFGLRVVYAHPRTNAELEHTVGAQRVDFDALVESSDIVSLHAPMRPENRHLFSRSQFVRMKRTAILINTARGPLVDEPALADALRTGTIAAAGLDVYEEEPRVHPALLDLPNVTLLPHLGSATTQTRGAMAKLAAENIVAVLLGRPALTPVT
ncbi:MAG: 2-hydroxyacid dehydrogenase [Phycisphaerae bacterium]